jgi:hypothetical protein
MLSKADLHMHTIFSDGLMSPEALVEYVATKTDLRVIAVTDHDTMAGALVARGYCEHFPDEFGHLEVIIGSEITSADGDILALFIEEDIPPKLSAAETVERIHAQGGVAIAAHPYASLLPYFGIDGMKGLGKLIKEVPLDGVETRNGTPTEFFSNPYTGFINRRNLKHAKTGGSDGHYLPTVGSTYTLFEGETAADLRRAIEEKTTRAGGRVYSPFYIFTILRDLLSRKLPTHTIESHHKEAWLGIT